MTKHPSMYITAMIGTSFSVTDAILSTPPRNIRAESIAITIPIVQPGTPNALEQDSEMELDWTMQPIKPRARIIATEKKPAKNLPKPPGKALRM